VLAPALAPTNQHQGSVPANNLAKRKPQSSIRPTVPPYSSDCDAVGAAGGAHLAWHLPNGRSLVGWPKT